MQSQASLLKLASLLKFCNFQETGLILLIFLNFQGIVAISYSFSPIMPDKSSSTLNKMKISHGLEHDGITSFYFKVALLVAGKFLEGWKLVRTAPIVKMAQEMTSGTIGQCKFSLSYLGYLSRNFQSIL